MPIDRYLIPRDLAPDVLAAELESVFEADFSKSVTTTRTWLDTFDWRLWRAGLELVHFGGREPGLRVFLREGGTVVSMAPAADPPSFVEELPEGPLRARVAPLVEIRRLLPLPTLRVEERHLAVTDDEEKTTARILLARERVGIGAPRLRLELEGLRGFADAGAAVARILVERLGLERDHEDRIAFLAASAGRFPGDVGGPFRVELVPGERADRGVRRVLRVLHATLVANEAGTLEDLDPEFLHDYRVAIRRTRSALSRLRSVFDRGETALFERGFRELGQVTGPARDADVWRLDWPAHTARVPAGERAALAPVEALLRAEREAARCRLVAALSEPAHVAFLAAWNGFLERGLDEHPVRAPDAARPIEHVAARAIRKAVKRIVDRGARIEESSPAADLHDLRKDAKKLRYLLEFFRSLLPPEETAAFIKALKKLQDVLGRYNDACVQEETLEGFGRRLREEAVVEATTFMALGRLLEELRQDRRRTRAAFAERFRSFVDADERTVLLKRLKEIAR